MKHHMFMLITLTFMVSASFAQSFAPRIHHFSKSKEATVTLKSGEELQGLYKGHKSKKGLIKLLKFQVSEDSIREISAEDIQSMQLVPSGIGKLAAFSEATATVKSSTSADVGSILKRDFVYFEQALLPGKKPQYVLLQLVNPGFDQTIKVYDDPRAQKTGKSSITGVSFSGSMLKSYYLVNEGEAVKIKKKDYRKQFESIFGTCNEIAETFKRIKFKEFAQHVYIHQAGCN